MNTIIAVRAAHAELVGLVRVVEAGGAVEIGRLGYPTVLLRAGMIEFRNGLAVPTESGRAIAAIVVGAARNRGGR